MKHIENRQLRKMRGSLQNKNKIRNIVFIFIISFNIAGCGKNVHFDEAELSEIVNNNDEIIELSGISENTIFKEKNEMVNRISELLGCGQRTSQSIYNIIKKSVGCDLVSIEREEDSVYKKIVVKTVNDNCYIVLIGRGYVVQEIYKDSCEGECIYRIIV